jgi:ketosteroid isomerase-like protein
MSAENVEIVRRAVANFRATGVIGPAELIGEDYAWDLSTFEGWPEEQTYEGMESVTRFLDTWWGQFDDWSFEVLDIVDIADRVVVIFHQWGHSKTSGVRVELTFGHVWTIRDGKIARVNLYATPEAARGAVGLEP